MTPAFGGQYSIQLSYGRVLEILSHCRRAADRLLVTPWSLRRQGFEATLSKLLILRGYPPDSNLRLTASEAATLSN